MSDGIKRAMQAALDKALEPGTEQCVVEYPGGFCTSLPCLCIEAIVNAALVEIARPVEGVVASAAEPTKPRTHFDEMAQEGSGV